MVVSVNIDCGDGILGCGGFAGQSRLTVDWRDDIKSLVNSFHLSAAEISAIVGSGRKRPTVFLHGNSSCKEIWYHQIAACRRRGHAVLAPDLPGYGQSGNAHDPAGTYSFPGYAAVISDLLDALDWRSVDVIGWSLGGHIGMQLLATDSRIQSLMILGAPPARPGTAALEAAFHTSSTMQLTGKRHFPEAEALAYSANMLGGERWVSPGLLAAVQRTDGDARHFMFANAMKGVGIDQGRLVEEATSRLCVIHGQDDPFVRLDYLLSLEYKRLWTNRIYVFAGAGHAPHWQFPDEFNALLLAFLSDDTANRDLVSHLSPDFPDR